MNKVHKSTFLKGMQTDLDKSIQPGDSYLHGRNVRVISNNNQSNGSLENIKGNVELLAFNSYEYLIGHVYLRDILVVFVVEDDGTYEPQFRIYTVNIVSNTKALVYYSSEDHGYYQSTKLSCVARYEQSDLQFVYITDGVNPIRSFNLGDPGIINKRIGYFDALPLVDSLSFSINNIGSGSLTAGTIQYYIQLYSKGRARSVYIGPSPQYIITKSVKGKERAGLQNENTNKALNIQVTPVFWRVAFNEYDNCDIIAVEYKALTAEPIVRLVDTISITGSTGFSFTDIGDNQGMLSLNDVTIVAKSLFSATVLATKDNILFAGGIKNIDVNITKDMRCYRFNENGIAYVYHDDTNRIKIYGNNNTWQYEQYSNGSWRTVGSVQSSWLSIPVDYNTLNYVNYYTKRNNTIFANSKRCLYKNKYRTSDTLVYGATGPNMELEFTGLIRDAANILMEETINGIGITNTSTINTIRSNEFLSYQRGEVYRIGSVIKDKKGRDSFVQWHCDMLVPSSSDVNPSTYVLNSKILNNFTHLTNDPGGVTYHPLFIKATLLNDSLHENNSAIKLVRVKRTYADSTVYQQGILTGVGRYNTRSINAVTDYTDRTAEEGYDYNTRYPSISPATYPKNIIPSAFGSIDTYRDASGAGNGGMNYAFLQDTKAFKFISPEILFNETFEYSNNDYIEILGIFEEVANYAAASNMSYFYATQGGVTPIVPTTVGDSTKAGTFYIKYGIGTQQVTYTFWDWWNNDMIYNNTVIGLIGIPNTTTYNWPAGHPIPYNFDSQSGIIYTYTDDSRRTIKPVYYTSDEDGGHLLDVYDGRVDVTCNTGNLNPVFTFNKELYAFTDLKNTSKTGIKYTSFTKPTNSITAGTLVKANKDLHSIADITYKNYAFYTHPFINLGLIEEIYGYSFLINGVSAQNREVVSPGEGSPHIDLLHIPGVYRFASKRPEETVGYTRYFSVYKGRDNITCSGAILKLNTALDLHTGVNSTSSGKASVLVNYCKDVSNIQYGGFTYAKRQDSTYISSGVWYPLYNRTYYGTGDVTCNIVEVQNTIYTKDITDDSAGTKIDSDSYIACTAREEWWLSQGKRPSFYPGLGVSTVSTSSSDSKYYPEYCLNGNVAVTVHIPLESKVKTVLRYDDSYSTSASVNRSAVREEAGTYWVGKASPDVLETTTANYHTQPHDLYSYNSVYSAEDLTKAYYPKPIGFTTTEYDFTIKYSDVKIIGDIENTWLTFRDSSYIQLDGNHGAVINLLVWKNTFFFWQSTAFGTLSVNERAVLPTDETTLILGTGGILSTPTYISTIHGTGAKEHVTFNNRSVYWYDTYNKTILRYVDSVYDILKTYNTRSAIAYTDTLKSLGYDPGNNEVLFTFVKERTSNFIVTKVLTTGYGYRNIRVDIVNDPKDDWYHIKNNIINIWPAPTTSSLNGTNLVEYENDSLVLGIYLTEGSSINVGDYVDLTYTYTDTFTFSDRLEASTGFYSIKADWYINNKLSPENYITFADNKLWLHNTGSYASFYNIVYPSNVKLLVNPEYTVTKRFDSIEYNSAVLDTANVNLLYDTFNQLRVYNDYQNTGFITLDPTDKHSIARKERSFTTQIPRNAVDSTVASNPNIFNVNANTTRQFRERITDKYCIIDLVYTNTDNKKLNIPYVTTSYTQSKR